MGNFSNSLSCLFELILPDNEVDLCIRICLNCLFFQLGSPPLFQHHGGAIKTLNEENDSFTWEIFNSRNSLFSFMNQERGRTEGRERNY